MRQLVSLIIATIKQQVMLGHVSTSQGLSNRHINH